MNILILGAHNIESDKTGCTSYLIDGILAVDAGALTRNLSFTAQGRLEAVLLTHYHYDHVRDIPALAINYSFFGKSLTLYGAPGVYAALTTHLLNDVLYPNYFTKPPGNPTLRFVSLEAGKTETISGYKVLPVPVKHAAPTTGYSITAPDGKQVFITSDTGPGLVEVWQQVSPQLLIIELTLTNGNEAVALASGHLTPTLLGKELEPFRQLKGYLPQVVVTHINPLEEKEIKAETSSVARALQTKITFAQEGMKLTI